MNHKNEPHTGSVESRPGLAKTTFELLTYRVLVKIGLLFVRDGEEEGVSVGKRKSKRLDLRLGTLNVGTLT